MPCKLHQPIPPQDLDEPFSRLQRSISIAVQSAVKSYWSMKPVLMGPHRRPHAEVKIKAGCLH